MAAAAAAAGTTKAATANGNNLTINYMKYFPKRSRRSRERKTLTKI